MRRSAWLAIVGAVTAQIAIVQTAEAGPSDAVLTGVVRNPSTNEAIEGAVVVVTGEHLIQERSMSTDSNGVYRIPNLPPGEYGLRAGMYQADPLRNLTVDPPAADNRIDVGAVELPQ